MTCELIERELASTLINRFAIIPVFRGTSRNFSAQPAGQLILLFFAFGGAPSWWPIGGDGSLDARSNGPAVGWLGSLPRFDFAFSGPLLFSVALVSFQS